MHESLLVYSEEDPRAEHAAEAFRALGPAAHQAIPQLIQLMNDSSRRWTPGRAAIALGYIGQDCLPALLTTLTNMPAPLPNCAAMGIGRMGTNARPALFTLIALLTNTNGLAYIAASTMGELRLEPALVVPALTNCFEIQRDSWTRSWA